MLLVRFWKKHLTARLLEVMIMTARQTSFSRKTAREVISNITSRHIINRADQKIFMSALLSKGTLSQEDQITIEKIHQGLQSGLIRVTD